MGGRPDGSKEKAKMDPSAMWVVTGKHESRLNGINALIYSMTLRKALLILLKGPDLYRGTQLFCGP